MGKKRKKKKKKLCPKRLNTTTCFVDTHTITLQTRSTTTSAVCSNICLFSANQYTISSNASITSSKLYLMQSNINWCKKMNENTITYRNNEPQRKNHIIN